MWCGFFSALTDAQRLLELAKNWPSKPKKPVPELRQSQRIQETPDNKGKCDLKSTFSLL